MKKTTKELLVQWYDAHLEYKKAKRIFSDFWAETPPEVQNAFHRNPEKFELKRLKNEASRRKGACLRALIQRIKEIQKDESFSNGFRTVQGKRRLDS